MTDRQLDRESNVAIEKMRDARHSAPTFSDSQQEAMIKDYMKTKLSDHEHKRAWGEVSGGVEHVAKKMGVPVIPTNKAGKLIGKEITPVGDTGHYKRKIGGHEHTKIAMGHPKED